MSLRDRINALNASTSNDTAPNLPTSSRTSSTISSGAKGSIKDKIGRFEEGAEAAPLLPIGRFGESISRRVPSGSEGGTKPRVASLGGGRANVPLGVVRAGRFSLGGAGGSNKDDSSNPSSSRSSSVDGSNESNLTGYKTPTDSTPPQSISPPSSTDMIDDDIRAESISSMDVETGSVVGESINDLSGVDTPTSQSAYASPVSSPIIESPLTPTLEPHVMALDEELPTDSTLLSDGVSLRGPISSLKEPVRTSSAISVSSMLVEDGSQATEGVANLSELDHTDERVSMQVDDIPTSVGGEGVDEHEHNDESDKFREEQTQIELERYEREVEDITVAPDVPSMETRQPVSEIVEDEPEERILKTPEPSEEIEKKHDTPVLSTFTTLTTGSSSFPTSVSLASLSSLTSGHTESDIGDFKMSGGMDVTPELTPKMGLEELAGEGGKRGDEFGGLLKNLSLQPGGNEPELVLQPPTPGMPKVKCQDCGDEVDLMELADHTYAPSLLPPAISSPNVNSISPLPSLSSTTNFDLDVPEEDELEIAGAFPSPKTTRFTTLSPSRVAWNPSADGGSPSTITKKSSTPLDFAPVTRKSVPDDVDDEDDDEFFKSNSRHSDSSTVVDPTSYSSFPSMVGSNRLSQVSTTSSSGSSSAGWGSRSPLPGGVPGVDDDEEEEDGYEGGSVTIVRPVV